MNPCCMLSNEPIIPPTVALLCLAFFPLIARVKKTMTDGTRRTLSAFLALLVALCGLSTACAEEARADQQSLPLAEATTSVDGEPCVIGQAIACVASGSEDQLEQTFDSVEFLLGIDAQNSRRGPCDLVLVRSSSQTVEELVGALEICEDVIFAEPNYLEEPQEEDPDGLWGSSPEESKEDAGDSQESASQEQQKENIGELQERAALTGASDAATRPDYTDKQYAFDGEFSVGVPGWNTYDSAGNPTPSVSAEGTVVAVVDSGVDYNHEDLRDVMWSEGEGYPELVALGGGSHGINVAPPRSDGTPYDTTDPMDDDVHGTHVAGIIAGKWNGFGVSGVACGARIMAIKVMNDEGAMSMSDALRAYRYIIAAEKAGVNVAAINNSWNDDVYSESLDMAVREAGRLGAVTVFAASNDWSDIDMVEQITNVFINNPYVVVVGNSDENGQMHESSNTGRRSVDVFAPGMEIYSTVPTGTGPADETDDPLIASGVAYACDYETTAVNDNADDSVFGFKGDAGTTFAIADEGHGASAHSLSLTADVEDVLTVSMSSKALAVGSECRGLCLWVKAPAAKSMVCNLTYFSVDGTSQQQRLTLEPEGDDWQLLTFAIDETVNKNALELVLSFEVYEWQESPDSTILIDDVKLTSATAPYDYQTGTSMAAPAVAGCAAVLAAAFPDDDAARRAARIVGSVKPMDDLSDLCVSEGIFRLDKALEQDTNPVLNEVSTKADTVAIDGYFFGSSPGLVSVDGQELTVVSWSETAITVQLPADFSPGEKLVEVTTEVGRTGHQFFRIDTPTSLYQRLPLPGRTLSGNPGDYTVTSSEFDESFYGAIPRALVGLNGSLYYLLETDDEQGRIFRYDIDERTWEQVYEGPYAPGGGACTWDGKILFVAGQPRENSTYFGLFDPNSNTAEYHLFDDQCFERECTLVNTGKGILLGGGRRFRYGDSRQLDIEVVRTVNPESFAVSTVALPEGVSLSDRWYAGAFDEEGNGYLFCGTRMEGFYKFSFANGEVACTVLEEGQLAVGAGGDAQHAPSANFDGSAASSQDERMVAGPTKSGIIASGPVMADDAGVIAADTYTVAWGDTKFEATDRQMSVTKMFNAKGTTYRGRFYVIAASESEEGGYVFASQPVETFDQPGDVSGSSDPVDPTDPAQPADSPDAPDSRDGGPSNGRKPDARPSGAPASPRPSAPQASSTSKLPATGDEQRSSLPFLTAAGALCLIAGFRKRMGCP